MAKYNLKRIDLYVPQYRTNATITIDENHSSGQPHLVVRYERGGSRGRRTSPPPFRRTGPIRTWQN
jgi:hypothetical protein